MSVRVESAALVGLLADLVQTASPSKECLPTSAVLLHGDRGDRVHEPGRVDLLVGTSLNRKVIGHTWAQAEGLLPPMLWPVDDARTVLAALKMKISGEHQSGVVPDARVYDPGLPPPPPPAPKPVRPAAGEPDQPAPPPVVDLDMPDWNPPAAEVQVDDDQLAIDDDPTTPTSTTITFTKEDAPVLRQVAEMLREEQGDDSGGES